MKIDKLILYTSRIGEQGHFYEHVLGFSCIHKSAREIVFRVGQSQLAFQYKESSEPYHFAFNIPAFSAELAYDWLVDKVVFLPWMGKDRVLFKDWKAEAIYFYDADKNIVELIAREKMDEEKVVEFTAKSVLGISEMGIGTTNIREVVNSINEMKEIDLYDGDLDRFCALGDEEGLFIVANSDLKTWMPTGDPIKAADFEISGTYNFRYKNGKINVVL